MALSFYEVMVRISAIVSVTIMAVTEDLEGFHGNDVFYAGIVAAIVIGPHALDRIAGEGTFQATTAAKTAILIGPLVALCMMLLRVL